MKKILTTVFAVLVACSGMCGVLLDGASADAKPKASASKQKPALSDSLGQLRWGMSVETAKSILADKIMEDFAKKVEGNGDLSYVDKIRRVYSDRVENMQKSFLVLTSDNSTTLSVSIVGEEFMPDVGESLLMQREDFATKYFFFRDDKLYKMAVVYDSSYLGPIAFDTFCATTEAKYGRAKDEVWDDDGNFNESIWTDASDVKLIVKNKYSSYSTFLMVFVDDKVERELAGLHKAYYDELNKGPEVSSAIDALTEDSGEGTQNSVDALLGKRTEVDLFAGLSDDEKKVATGEYAQEEEEKAKKAKAKKEKKTPKKSNAKAKAGLEIF